MYVDEWCHQSCPWVHKGENLLKENKWENLLAWNLQGFSRNVIPPAKQQPAAHSSTFIKYMQLLKFLMKKSTFSSSDGPWFDSNIVPGKHLLAKTREHKGETVDRKEQIWQVAAGSHAKACGFPDQFGKYWWLPWELPWTSSIRAGVPAACEIRHYSSLRDRKDPSIFTLVGPHAVPK